MTAKPPIADGIYGVIVPVLEMLAESDHERFGCDLRS